MAADVILSTEVFPNTRNVLQEGNGFDCPVAYIGLEKVLSLEELIENPLNVAAANWIATSKIVAEIDKNCIFVDTGSTTTDIIPIRNGKEIAKGRTDFERSATGELVYTGTLRTNLTSFLDFVPLDDKNYRLASELFAITADVYNVLGLIDDEDYVCATADGAGKSKEDSARRISRVLCADLDILSMDDIIEIANEGDTASQIYDAVMICVIAVSLVPLAMKEIGRAHV